MKFCSHCGAEINDDAVICMNCGCQVDGADTQEQDPGVAKTNQNLGTAAKVFYILTMVACAFNAVIYLPLGYLVYALCLLIPLAWVIPMFVVLNKKLKNGEPIGTGFKVCSLLFVNLIAGILLLCRKEQQQ